MEWLHYHHLQYFWVMAREGGIARASAKLHLSQPTISAQIKRLEEVLGVRLFQRHGRALVGRTDSVEEHYYAISAERRLTHPGVLAITNVARERLFR